MPKQKRGPAKVANKVLLRFDPDTLQHIGPIFPASWLVPEVQTKQLQGLGRPVPDPVSGYILLDTGAQSTCISKAAAQSLGLKAVSKAKGFGAGGSHVNDVVYARLVIRIRDHRGLKRNLWWDRPYQAIPEMERHYAGLEIDSEPIILIGLLGRDILRLASVMYNGKNGNLDVTFDPQYIRSMSAANPSGPKKS